MAESDPVFVSGMYLDRVHEKAPAYIITNQTIQVEQFIKWLQEHKHLANEKGYIKLVGKESKNVDEKGNFKRYFQVDMYKSAPKNEAPVLPDYPEDDEEDLDIPF